MSPVKSSSSSAGASHKNPDKMFSLTTKEQPHEQSSRSKRMSVDTDMFINQQSTSAFELV